MRNRRIGAVLICLIMIMGIMLSSCGGTVPSGSGETFAVTDTMGREVQVPENVQRVACLDAAAAHIMALLDEGDKIVGAPNGVKSDVIMQMKYPKIKDVTSPSQEGTINIEELIRLDADLVIVKESVAASEGETEKLDKLGIPYVAVDFYSIDELYDAVDLMGRIFHDEEKAGEYISFSSETIDKVQSNLQKAGAYSGKQKRVYHSVNEAIRTDEKDSICCEITDLAGVKNISSDKDLAIEGGKTYATLEEIYKWNPDAIIANEYSVKQYIETDSKWSGLKAVKDGEVYCLPVGLSRWCHPGSIEPHMGVLAIADVFYGSEITGINLKEFTRKYYRDFFNLDLSDETMNDVLSGQGMRKSNAAVK